MERLSVRQHGGDVTRLPTLVPRHLNDGMQERHAKNSSKNSFKGVEFLAKLLKAVEKMAEMVGDMTT